MGNLYSGSNQMRILKRFTKDKKLARKTAHHLLWSLRSSGVSLVAQTAKNMETWVLSLGQEDPLEKGMATHSSILAWRIPCAEEPGGL